MRHNVRGKKLGRDTKHRIALFKNLARALVLHGTVTTTIIKGKELKRLADKLVTAAKGDSMSARRMLHIYFGKRDVVNTLVDRVVPVMQDRKSGFTTLTKIGTRLGDNTDLVTVAWVNMPATVGNFANPNPEVRKPSVKKAAAPKTVKTVKAEVKTESKPEKKVSATAVKAPAKKAAAKTTKKSK
jgi:large subunit ribosomal protein L17